MAREYVVYLVLAKDGKRPIYNWSVWRNILPGLGALFGQEHGESRICALHLDTLRQRLVIQNKLAWGDRSQQRWTHCSPITTPFSGRLSFVGCEMWLPFTFLRSATAHPPDVFVSIHRPFPQRTEAYDTSFLLAVSADLPPELLNNAAPALIRRVSGLTDSVGVAWTTSPWCNPLRTIGGADAIPSWTWQKVVGALVNDGTPAVACTSGIWHPLVTPIPIVIEPLDGLLPIDAPARHSTQARPIGL